jgi:hypothetical protein
MPFDASSQNKVCTFPIATSGIPCYQLYYNNKCVVACPRKVQYLVEPLNNCSTVVDPGGRQAMTVTLSLLPLRDFQTFLPCICDDCSDEHTSKKAALCSIAACRG